MLQEKCFWSADAPAQKSYADRPLTNKTDVVVVGGGLTGTSAALRLAKSGVKVILLEAQTLGWGASSRNGGQALSCLHHNLTDLIKQYGIDRATAMFQTAVQAAEAVKRIIREEGIDCGYERCGHIEAASKPAHFRKLLEEQETLARIAGFKTQIIPKRGMAFELGTAIYHGLMINERSGKVQPAKFVQGMGMAAERAGADIHEATRVLGIERKGDLPSYNGTRFVIRTDRGTVEAKEVFIAANAWSGEIIPHFRRRVFPVESFIIATKPLREDVARRLIPKNRVVYDTKNMVAYYRLSSDNRLVFGGEGTASGSSAITNITILRRGMVDVFPELKDVQIDYFWGGPLGMTMDQTPHAGQVDGLWYAMCYVGHGVTLATYMGEQIANALLGKDSMNPFDGLNIPPVPFFNGRAWFVNLGRWWYRILDSIG
jgi:glycine/D-amino acid oxidase-like deaminating enzyme